MDACLTSALPCDIRTHRLRRTEALPAVHPRPAHHDETQASRRPAISRLLRREAGHPTSLFRGRWPVVGPMATEGDRFRHLSPEVPETAIIADNPRASAPTSASWHPHKSPATRPLSARNPGGGRIAPRRSPVRARLAPFPRDESGLTPTCRLPMADCRPGNRRSALAGSGARGLVRRGVLAVVAQ
jgi:hypothetical protein